MLPDRFFDDAISTGTSVNVRLDRAAFHAAIRTNNGMNWVGTSAGVRFARPSSTITWNGTLLGA